MEMPDYTFDEDGIPVLRESIEAVEYNRFADEEDLTDIFHVKDDGYDVTLSLQQGIITWTSVNPGGRKKGLFGKKKGNKSNGLTVYLNYVIGVKIKRRRSSEQKEGEGVCLGFAINVVEQDDEQCLLHKTIDFEHPSEEVCSRYVQKIRTYINTLTCRPKSVKLFLQPYAGSKQGRTLFKHKVLPLFKAADVHVDCIEVQHNEYIKQEMIHINMDDYDCVVAMGGDGTVNKLANGLLNWYQKYKDIDPKPGFSPVRARVPLGIIPIGTTNHIARSVLGTHDITNAVLNIILGATQPTDICSVYDEDKFAKWAFNCQYGFAGNVLHFRHRYSKIGKRGLEPAFVKALTKAKLRSYQCDIEYIPADPLPTSRKNTPCFRGCEICWQEEETDSDSVTNDLVEEFNPLSTSNDSDTLVVDLAKHEDNPWRVCKGDYMNIGLYAIPGRDEIAPRGLSKYTHLNDGVMELVLIKQTDKKEFVRYVKRLGNSKNQFDLPFVEVKRVKEVRFRLRIPVGFNYKDYDFCEIDYEMSRQEKQQQQHKHEEITEVLDLEDADDEISDLRVISRNSTHNTSHLRRTHSLQTNDTQLSSSGDFDSEDEETDDDDEDDDEVEECSTVINGLGVKTVRSNSAPPQNLCGPAYRMTFAEKDRMKRKMRQRKKEEKQKKREERKMRSYWNIDNEIRMENQLDFKVHHGLLQIYGQGVSPKAVFKDATILSWPLRS